eukprot:scaffold387996_cov42-Prasinocladus_malaysianus.AAC.1
MNGVRASVKFQDSHHVNTEPTAAQNLNKLRTSILSASSSIRSVASTDASTANGDFEVSATTRRLLKTISGAQAAVKFARPRVQREVKPYVELGAVMDDRRRRLWRGPRVSKHRQKIVERLLHDTSDKNHFVGDWLQDMTEQTSITIKTGQAISLSELKGGREWFDYHDKGE